MEIDSSSTPHKEEGGQQQETKHNPYLSTMETVNNPLKRKSYSTLSDDGATQSKKTKMLGARADSVMRGHNVLVKKQPNRRSEQYIYGNYRNYYESRRGNQITVDHRLDMLDPSLFKGKRVLDIGCNSGNITTVIGLQHKPTHILGVDIDESLIKQAEKQLRLVNSLHNPHGDNATDVHMRFHYFPRALSSTFGFIAMNMPPNHKSTEFPYNVKFKAKDWLDDDDDDGSAEQDGKKRKGNKQKKIRYDTVLALSITKWIHINRGDEGMKEFFNKVYKVLNPGGAFVVEPQEFDTYERRAKLNETTQAVFKSIEFRPEQFHDYLMKEVGFSKFEDLGSSGEKRKGFDRPMHMYIK